MGCTDSKESKPAASQAQARPDRRPSAAHSDPAVSPRAHERHVSPKPVSNEPPPRTPWENGADFPRVVEHKVIAAPDRDLKGAELSNCTLSDGQVHAIEGCTFRKCTITDAVLSGCKLYECELHGTTVKGGEIKDSTITDASDVRDNCAIDRCLVSAGCTVTACEIGRTLTTIDSTYRDCTGCPEPPPAVKDCVNCTWERQGKGRV